MLFKFRKFYSLLLIAIFTLCMPLCFGGNASGKIKGDCAVSVGPACRPAHWLRETHKRFQAFPFDWMMKYSLDTVNHCVKTKFSDFFEDVEATGEIVGNERVVKDKKNNIVSIHHFSKNMSLEDGKKDVRDKMIRRGKKMDVILKKSQSIILVANRQKDSLDDFKKFIKNFSKMYPGRNITLVNIRSNDSDNVTKKLLYEGDAATAPKKKQVTKKNPTIAKKKNQTTSKNQTTKKKRAAKKRRKLKIIQYSFNDTSSSWKGNSSGWQKVMDDIELTDRLFDKNMDFKSVEF